MITTFKRIVIAGFLNFWRNGWLSTATISVMMLALSMVLGLVLLSVLTESLVGNLENKIDVSVYFNPNTEEGEVLKVKNDLLALKEVKSVVYVSRDEALARFKEKHKEDTVVLQALEEIDTNPLEASLNIKAKDATDFPVVVSFLEGEQYKDLISKVNYYENKEVIARLTGIVSAIRKGGAVASAILALIALLVAFNTIRIAIYTLRNEISIMKLVGATNWFVRGPFLIAGALYGAVASIATMLVFYPFIFVLSPVFARFFPGTDLLAYFTQNFLTLWFILFVAGIVLSVAGSVIAIRKHLKI
ncbi:MAG: ABC transporter permease [Candidatus Azambacteria bacterium]|nr:ABC transporter permease [Candidatus Azambacteria bacterium]